MPRGVPLTLQALGHLLLYRYAKLHMRAYRLYHHISGIVICYNERVATNVIVRLRATTRTRMLIVVRTRRMLVGTRTSTMRCNDGDNVETSLILFVENPISFSKICNAYENSRIHRILGLYIICIHYEQSTLWMAVVPSLCF